MKNEDITEVQNQNDLKSLRMELDEVKRLNSNQGNNQNETEQLREARKVLEEERERRKAEEEDKQKSLSIQ